MWYGGWHIKPPVLTRRGRSQARGLLRDPFVTCEAFKSGSTPDNALNGLAQQAPPLEESGTIVDLPFETCTTAAIFA